MNDKTFELNSLIDIKGDKAQGNQLTKLKVKDISLLPVDENDSWPSIQVDDSSKLDEDLQESAEHNSSDQVNNEKESSRDDSTNKVTISSEGPVEVEWEVDNKDDDSNDEAGQMKIF